MLQRVIFYVNKGDHGFSNQEMDMKMIFRAFGPDFKKNFLAEPFDSVNIYPLMCKLLGVDPAPNNGSLGSTQDMLVDVLNPGKMVRLLRSCLCRTFWSGTWISQ